MARLSPLPRLEEQDQQQDDDDESENTSADVHASLLLSVVDELTTEKAPKRLRVERA